MSESLRSKYWSLLPEHRKQPRPVDPERYRRLTPSAPDPRTGCTKPVQGKLRRALKLCAVYDSSFASPSRFCVGKGNGGHAVPPQGLPTTLQLKYRSLCSLHSLTYIAFCFCKYAILDVIFWQSIEFGILVEFEIFMCDSRKEIGKPRKRPWRKFVLQTIKERVLNRLELAEAKTKPAGKTDGRV